METIIECCQYPLGGLESYRNSFFSAGDGEMPTTAITTMRAGNVIGGGDFATDRIIPDCVRAAMNGEDIIVRNPNSIRPYQHVIEPVYAYLYVAAMQYIDHDYAGSYNVGPDDKNAVTTGEIATMFCDKWNAVDENGKRVKWINQSDGGPHEANYLKLNCEKLKDTFGISPKWDIDTAMDKLVEWYHLYSKGGDVFECAIKQIEQYLDE